MDIKKFIRRREEKIGLPPGTTVYIGDQKVEGVRISCLNYGEDRFEEKQLESIEACFSLRDQSGVTWINIDGIHQIDIIERVGRHLGLHPLVIEDIANSQQRPKVEEFENYLYIVLKMLQFDETEKEIKAEQVSLILGNHFVVSFQERPGDIFNRIRERIKNGKGRIRKMGPDYLAYSLMDAIVDHYFFILEKLGDDIEFYEENLVTDPQPVILQELHRLKREMIFLRKSVWPLRELINNMERMESNLIDKQTQRYLRDIYDHSIQVIDTVETFRDILSGMHDTYLSGISNRMNEIMKVLTIIATIFIPLTFIAGVYGMNFKFMPELEWRWGYFLIWGIMTALVVLMVIYFKRKKWL